jgi:hypothetical protein
MRLTLFDVATGCKIKEALVLFSAQGSAYIAPDRP